MRGAESEGVVHRIRKLRRPSRLVTAMSFVWLGVGICCVGVGLVFVPAALILGGVAVAAYGLLGVEVRR